MQIDEVMSALDLLRDCNTVSALGLIQDTDIYSPFLDAPALQSRASTMDATGELLKDMLPGDSWWLPSVTLAASCYYLSLSCQEAP